MGPDIRITGAGVAEVDSAELLASGKAKSQLSAAKRIREGGSHMNPGMYSSATDQWATPQHFFDRLDRVFKFELDVCALPGNAKCDRYFSPEIDGLSQPWSGVVWMNPPYGREIGKWVKKAWEESRRGATVVCLLPARTDTAWWHDYCANGEIHHVRGRLKFGNAKDSAPFPSAVVVFRPSLADVDWTKPATPSEARQ